MLPETTLRADELLAELTDQVDQLRSATGTPGVAYGVVAGGELVVAGAGSTSVADPREVTPETLFRLCSLTKPMTATLAVALVEDGRLQLDAPVARWLPDLRLADEHTRQALTLRHLLCHTSGLEGEWRGDLEAFGRNDDALARLVAEYPLLAQYAPLGSHWGYCNTGYWLAGHLIATVTGRPFEEALRERLFEPLDMSRAVLRAEDAVLHRIALPHRPVGPAQEPVRSFAFPRARVPSGGVVASVRDVLAFAAASLADGGGVVSPDGVRLLQEPAVPAEGIGVWQSAGWQITITEQGIVAHHGGSYDGYATRLMLFPSAGIAVAVLTNSDAGGELCRAVQRWAIERVLDHRVEEASTAAVDPETLASYAGRYVHPGADYSDVRIADGHLHIELSKRGQTSSSIGRPVSERDFVLAGGRLDGSVLSFLAAGSGGASIIRIGQRLGARAER
jgi:CubicO group peptidase (beta-lactamase class C family)